MIVKILSRGKSFNGLAAYLTHDPDETKTAERVAWTQTLNLANDHVPSAVDEMLWTARDAELLKQEAGVRAGGRATENAVKHISLNWSPEDKPTREHMIETTQDFLRHMKWQEHQAILVAHNDKAYAHVHVMLNVVHPETGLRLDDNFERRRAQAWALEYEREQGRIYCEQRLKNPEQRENAPPRNIWTAFQENEKQFENSEKSLRENTPILVDERKNQDKSAWQILKEIQRTERIDFFSAGKSEFSELRLSIYREVREEFRDRWANFYSAQREGADPDTLATLKAELVADQKAVLENRRDEACSALRESRDGLYRQLLDDQRDIRLDLRARQEAGLETTSFLQSLKDGQSAENITTAFQDAAEATTRQDDREWGADVAVSVEASEREPSEAETGANMDVGDSGFAVGAFSVFDSILSIFEGPKPNPRPRAADQFQPAADNAAKRQEQEREEADAESRKRKERSRCGE